LKKNVCFTGGVGVGEISESTPRLLLLDWCHSDASPWQRARLLSLRYHLLSSAKDITFFGSADITLTDKQASGVGLDSIIKRKKKSEKHTIKQATTHEPDWH